MNRINHLFVVFLTAGLLFTSCDTDLDQTPPNLATSGSLTEFGGVLNAAYFYQLGSVTPVAFMGDFRADNAMADENPLTDIDVFNPNLTSLENDFFGPFYTAMYRSILSTNTVLENSTNSTELGEARFLRALSYFKLVRAFGAVPVNLQATPSTGDESILIRRPASEVYNSVIIPDLQEAISTLDNSGLSNGRASRLAAQALLGKVYLQQGDFANAEGPLADAVNAAPGAGITLRPTYAEVFGIANELNSELIFVARRSISITDEYGFSEFWTWFSGTETKAFNPVDQSLVAAFDASPGDLRRATVIDSLGENSPKYPADEGDDQDWIELRLADVILMLAEARNENGTGGAAVLSLLDPIRMRAGVPVLSTADLGSQAAIRQAIQDERRLELAFEGQRWFDLVRTGTVNAEMGQTIDPNFFLFPIPISEISSSFNVITQNPGYQ